MDDELVDDDNSMMEKRCEATSSVEVQSSKDSELSSLESCDTKTTTKTNIAADGRNQEGETKTMDPEAAAASVESHYETTMDEAVIKKKPQKKQQRKKDGGISISCHRSTIKRIQARMAVVVIIFMIVLLITSSQQDTEQLEEDEEDGWLIENRYQHHYEKDAILPLLDWEVQAIQGIQQDLPPGLDPLQVSQETCQPPHGIPSYCCPGTYGGHLESHNHHVQEDRFNCDHVTMQDYQTLWNNAQDFMDRTRTHEKASKSKTTSMCDVCRIIDLAIDFGLSLHFLGDATSMQVFTGMECELYRRNYRLKASMGPTPYCHNCPHPLSHHIVQVERRRLMGSNSKKLWSKFKNKDHPNNNNNTTTEESPWESTTLHFYHGYDFPTDHPEMEEYVMSQADVLILNFGLNWHHDNREDHLLKLSSLFTNIWHYAKTSSQLVIFREPMAQHFPNKAGDHSFYQDASKIMQCDPLLEREKSLSKWRDETVKTAAKTANFDIVELNPRTGQYPPPITSHEKSHHELIVLPFFEFTSTLYRFHPDVSGRRPDCHSYCSTPYLFMPLWRSLRLAMDRQYEKKSK